MPIHKTKEVSLKTPNVIPTHVGKETLKAKGNIISFKVWSSIRFIGHTTIFLRIHNLLFILMKTQKFNLFFKLLFSY